MSRDRWRGIWMQCCGAMQQLWGALTDDPAAVAAGALRGQRGVSKQQADRQLRDFQKHHRNWRDLSSR